jgi:DNA modification methylase
MLTLNTQQSQKRAMLHVCPLQTDIIDRLITRYSNPNEIIYDPFGGLFTVPYMAIKLGRYGIGSELNHQYFLDGVAYCKAAEQEHTMPTLFSVEQYARREPAMALA